MPISIHLKVYEGGKLKLSRLFRSEQIRIGSGSCDLVLEGTGVAPSHAVIDAGSSGAVLRSVGPAPLYLNGQPIIAAPLRHGDLISVGELRVMVELRTATLTGVPEKRPRLQLIEGEAERELEATRAHPPSLAVVRDEPLPRGTEARSDRGIHGAIPDLPTSAAEPVPETLPHIAPQSIAAVAAAEPLPAPVLPLRGLPPLAPQALQGGECVEAELFWAHTRISVRARSSSRAPRPDATCSSRASRAPRSSAATRAAGWSPPRAR